MILLGTLPPMSRTSALTSACQMDCSGGTTRVASCRPGLVSFTADNFPVEADTDTRCQPTGLPRWSWISTTIFPWVLLSAGSSSVTSTSTLSTGPGSSLSWSMERLLRPPLGK
jgi:hypothetical protein